MYASRCNVNDQKSNIKTIIFEYYQISICYCSVKQLLRFECAMNNYSD